MEMSRGYHDCFGGGLDTWELVVLVLLFMGAVRLGYTALRGRRPSHSAAGLRLGSRRRGGGAST